MTSKEFIEKLIDVSKRKTYYIKGGFGLVLNASGKKRAIKQYKYNEERADKINALDPATFGFDCCGLIKGVIWGFDGSLKKTYGGAEYKSNGLDDLNEKGIFNICKNISDDMQNIRPGEFLYMPGHCGIYLGNGNVIESTPSGSSGVQITDFNRVKWKAHGELPQISYGTSENKTLPVIPSQFLKQGSRGMSVYYLQKCLNFLGASLVTDGIYGPKTKQALMDFQKRNNLVIDGIYGPKSQKKLREVLK